MANTPNQDSAPTGSSAQRRGQTIPDNESLETDDRGTQPYQNQSQSQEQKRGSNRDTPDPIEEGPHDGKVEIGDPVPEDDRTIRATGETGEDEDLPADDGQEGSRSERH